jgi:hypothetical protein
VNVTNVKKNHHIIINKKKNIMEKIVNPNVIAMFVGKNLVVIMNPKCAEDPLAVQGRQEKVLSDQQVM